MTDLRTLHPVTRAVRDHFGNATVLAAVSGGADSMAMFDALCALSRERPGLRVVAAHFNHHLRPDSDHDRDAVAAFADARMVPAALGEGDVRARARRSHESLETAARAMRYAFLERAADEHGAELIATAHTRSDQVETVLMRILRGAGARGLAGIPVRRGRIVRPLLAVTRAETHDYCARHGVPCVTDPSNEDRRHARNHVRHEVLPALRAVYPGLDAALERVAASARIECERADARVGERVATHLHESAPGQFVLAHAAFAELDEDERQHLFSRALDAMDSHRDVSRIHYRALLALARDDARTGVSVDLPRLRARREHDGIVFAARAGATTDPAALRLDVPGRVVIGAWEIRADVTSPGPASAGVPGGPLRFQAGGGGSVTVPAGAGTHVVRYPRPGDRMRPFGMTGTKKLSDIFVDAKVPQRLRARTPVVERAGEIIWVVGVAAGEATRITPGAAEVIRLTAAPVEGA